MNVVNRRELSSKLSEIVAVSSEHLHPQVVYQILLPCNLGKGQKTWHDDRGTNWWAVVLNPLGHEAILFSNMNTSAIA